MKKIIIIATALLSIVSCSESNDKKTTKSKCGDYRKVNFMFRDVESNKILMDTTFEDCFKRKEEITYLGEEPLFKNIDIKGDDLKVFYTVDGDLIDMININFPPIPNEEGRLEFRLKNSDLIFSKKPKLGKPLVIDFNNKTIKGALTYYPS